MLKNILKKILNISDLEMAVMQIPISVLAPVKRNRIEISIASSFNQAMCSQYSQYIFTRSTSLLIKSLFNVTARFCQVGERHSHTATAEWTKNDSRIRKEDEMVHGKNTIQADGKGICEHRI